MILITVTGQTHPLRKLFHDNKFRRNGKSWQKTVGEAGINHAIESIRPPVSWSDEPSPRITVTLQSVDVWGNEMHKGELRFKLKAGERARVDIFELFLDEVSDVQVITTHSRPANADMREKGNVDGAFF